MKKTKLIFTLAVAAFGVVQVVCGLNYSSTDLVLVFRQDGLKDVEIDLGSVTNFLGQPVGTRTPVNYDKNVVMTNFPNGLTGVKFVVIGSTAQADSLPRVWLTDADVFNAPGDLTFSSFGVLRDKVDSVGVAATLATASNSSPYVVSVSASSSYDYLVTSGAGSAASTMYGDAPVAAGGVAPLAVDAVNPTTLALYEVRISTANPKPAAQLIGALTMEFDGTLYFTAGSLPPLSSPQITDVSVDALNQISTVSFTTTNGINYSLFYSSSLGSGWKPVVGAGTVAGDGTVQSLVDSDASDAVRFYRVLSGY